MLKIKIIGIGGVGKRLVVALSQFLVYCGKPYVLTLIDGDDYEHKNRDRQLFSNFGNKAIVTRGELLVAFPNLAAGRSVKEYVTADNIEYLINSGDIVFLCVDNHATRNLVSQYCETLADVVLISGGNELMHGNVQVFVRQGGKNSYLPIANKYHPEIMQPTDVNPGEAGCEEGAVSEPQLIFTNMTVASFMLNYFYQWLNGKLTTNECYFDILTNNARSLLRK